ncbi:mercury resistance protein (plasmid) [Klebsiella pneumoniae]|nr:broad-spectrum mercury transporter MerE [Klebsiella pneumoniae]AOA94009.1 mercury resistance protein [Klebsiella pneumoniae]
MGSCAAPSAKGDDKFITTDYLQQCLTGYLWGALAVLTCPCHLPILAIVLAGTTAGAFIGEHWGIAALTLTGLFVLSVTRLLRAFKGRS